MKLTGLCFLVAAGGGIGCLRAAALRGRVNALSTVLRFIDWLMREVRYTAAPMSDLLKRAEMDLSFQTILNSGEKVNYFTDEDNQQFERFMEGLGTTDLEGQLSHGAFYTKVFDERVREAEQVCACRGRTEVMLWTGGAAVLALLLL